MIKYHGQGHRALVCRVLDTQGGPAPHPPGLWGRSPAPFLPFLTSFSFLTPLLLGCPWSLNLEPISSPWDFLSELWLLPDCLMCSLPSDPSFYASCIFLKGTLSPAPTHSLLGKQKPWALNCDRPEFEFWIFCFPMCPLVMCITASISICPDEKPVHSAGIHQTPTMCQALSSPWVESLSRSRQKSLHSWSLCFCSEGHG